jgi:hypothetical protein
MKKQIALIITLMGFALSIPAQESAHVHGKGKMLISQEKNAAHIQLILPGADVLGFKLDPDAQEQHEVADKFTHNISIVKLDGKCSLEDIMHSLLEHKDIDQHGDVEVEYVFTCQSGVTKVSVTLFEWIKSFTSIELQWVLDHRMTVLTRDVLILEW